MAKLFFAAFVAAVLTLGCSLPLHGRRSVKSEKPTISPEARLALVRRAQVWTPTQVAQMDILGGPHHKGFLPGDRLTCDYVDKQFGGHTPKFGCTLNHEDVLKVRYGRDNGEVYAGVAATRLLWALGFGADALYPVHVVCRGCPAKLRSAGDGTASGDATAFDVAAVERKFPGRDIEAAGVIPGWSWAELDLVDPREGGAPAAERDALKLLAVFLQDSDNKADQQRLVCRDPDVSKHHLESCAEPFMMIHDVGETFGRANLFNRGTVGSVNFEMWSTTPVWKDRAHCVGNLAQSETGTLYDPVISEAGRKFLADLLAQLTDAQLHDLFSVARFSDKPHGGAPIDAWVAAFKEKREEIVAANCS